MSRWRVFGLFSIAYVLSYFYGSANAVISPDLARELSLGAGELGFMTSVFYAAFAAAQLPLGAALDRFGPRATVPALMLLAAVGSVVFASAHSFAALAAGRALMGAGMAAVLMGSFKAFSLWFPPGRFAAAAGLVMGIGAVGGLLSATPLAYASDLFGWRSVFMWGSAAVVASAAAIFFFTRNAPPGVVLPRVEDGETSGGFLAMFADSRFWRIAPLSFFAVGGLLGVQGLWAGPYLFDVVGLSKVSAGNVLLFMGVGAAAGAAASGILASRFGFRRVVLPCGTVFVLCQLALAGQVPAAVPYLLFGFSAAACDVLLAHARAVFPPSMTGRAVTAVNLFGMGGVFVLQWAFGLVLDASGGPIGAGTGYPPAAYAVAFLLTAAGTTVALLFYLPLDRKGGLGKREEGVRPTT